ncbi:MAG: YceI family protein [Acidimicrobiaceae bacterium]|nr:YceI family protein [Acidimicrobiaceae bacterium]
MAIRLRKWKWWIGGAAAGVVVLAVGGPFIYIHLIEGAAPAKLSLSGSSGSTGTKKVSQSSTSASSPTAIAGKWNVSTGSTAGYRVSEVLIGQNSTAVGRTSQISGSIDVTGSELSTATFTVDMASVKSDQSQRNAQFDGRIMDVSTYPTAKFTLTRVVNLARYPRSE